MNKDTICIVPWTQLDIGPIGNVRPCCEYSSVFRNDDGSKITLDNSSISEIWNGNHFRDLRRSFIAGEKPKNCSQCWQIEDMGEVSRRQNENNRYEKYFDRISTEVSPTPVHIDIKFGNLCNLKCRICSSINSNAWVTEEIALYGKADSNTTSAWIEPESPIWNDLEQMIPTLETLYLSGGEPLLLKHHWKFLDKCFEMQRSDQIEIRYITNGTISVTDTQLETWSKFKKIRLLVSIDDIEERFEYQRYPAKWNTVKENLLKFKEIQNIEIGIVCSVSIFNVYYLPELIKECYSLGIPQSDIYMNFVRKPVEFDASLLTISQKQMIIDHLQQCDDALVTQVISYLKTSSEITSDEFLGKMRDNDLTIDNYRLSIISKSDQYRNQNFKDYFPEMAGILNAD